MVALVMLMAVGGLRAEQSGPTPYPDTNNAAAWPGKGPIRVFGWMVDNRNWFWTQRDKARGAVVFVGDSLTANWDRKKMAETFAPVKVANRGIGGDVSRGLLFRFREDALDLEPRALVMCIGTNDLSAHANPADVESNIAAILKQARDKSPAVPIVLCNIPPREHPNAPTKPGAIADLNERIATLAASDDRITLLDLNKLLADAEGHPIADCFADDRLHLVGPGYDKWAAALGPIFEKMGIK